MSSEIRDAIMGIRQFQPVPWDLIPDLGLYMDQVITFIGRMYQPLYGEDIKRYLSAAMINNYVKSRLIPRPNGKKYTREQIALLSMIVALKQVSSMEDIRHMLQPAPGQSVQSLYSAFCSRFSRILQTLRPAPADSEGGELDIALEFAICAAGYHAGCMAALASEDGATPEAEP